MVGHEYTTSTTATPITVATTMKTKSSVSPRNNRSVGFLPNRVVTHARLRCMTPRSSDTLTCFISPLFHGTLHCLPGRVDCHSSRNYRRSCSTAGAWVELPHAPAVRLLAMDTCITCRTPTFHGVDLGLIQVDNFLWERYVAEGSRILLTIMRDPPEHIRNGHPFVCIALVLVHKRPGETGDGIGGIARRIDKVEAQVIRDGGYIRGSRCRAFD